MAAAKWSSIFLEPAFYSFSSFLDGLTSSLNIAAHAFECFAANE